VCVSDRVAIARAAVPGNQSYRVSFSPESSCAVAWEVTAGEAGKICTIRSPTVLVNRTNMPMEVVVTRGGRSDNVGEVSGPGVLPVPLVLLTPEALTVRPFLGSGSTCAAETLLHWPACSLHLRKDAMTGFASSCLTLPFPAESVASERGGCR
jgi:hypothetical protein